MEPYPIDTAPKDGTVILAKGTQNGGVDFEPQKNKLFLVRWSKNYGGSWQVVQPTPNYWGGFTPESWVPLPTQWQKCFT